MIDIRKKFTDPPPSYGPTPFWAVNEGMEPDALEKSLIDMKEKGMGGVIIHPRTGLEVEYLSPRFWEGIDFIVETLARLGIHGWIYDEYNWPSGVVGGKLLQERPEYRQRGLTVREVKGAASVELKGPLIAAFDMDDGMKSLPGQEGLRTYIPPHNTRRSLVFFLETMTEKTFATTCAPWAGEETGMIDYLNPNAVKFFMEHTHFEYARRYSKHFGKTILGVFTDEPQNHRGLIWCADFPEEFKRRAGYDLLPVLHRLAADSPECAKTRIDYYRVAADLYRERYFDAVGKWCSDNGLIFTGHLSQEDSPALLQANHGSLFEPLSAMQMPGVDWLGLGWGMSGKTTLADAPNLNPKVVSSVAHLMGRERSLVELWGGGGWKATPAIMKFSLDWMFGCGVNFINPHQVWVSAKGMRKRDFPQTFSKLEPWWEYFGLFSKYIARLSYLLSQGTHRAGLLVLFPTVAIWAASRMRGEHTQALDSALKGLMDTTDRLLASQLDFDYLFEEALGKYKIADGAIEAGAEKFGVVIVPPGISLDKNTARWLDDARKAGVRIIDRYSNADELVDVLRKDSPAPLTLGGAVSESIVTHCRSIDGAHVYFLANLSDTPGRVEITLRGMAGQNVEIWDPESGGTAPADNVVEREGDATVSHYFEAGASIVFACTDKDSAGSDKAAALRSCDINSLGPVSVIDLKDGWRCDLSDKNLYLIEPWSVKTNRRQVRNYTHLRRDRRYGLRPKLLMGIAKAAVSALNPVMRPEKKYYFERFFDFGGSRKAIPLAEKAFGVSFDKMGLYEGMNFMEGMLEYIPAVAFTAVPFPLPGENYTMKATLDVESVPEDAEVVYEDVGEKVSFIINGKRAPEGTPIDVWDRCNRSIPVAEMLRVGRNEIIFDSRMPSYPAMFPCNHAPEIIVLRGSFKVSEKKIVAGRPQVSPGGSWTRMGLPNYMGEVVYRRSFNISEAPADSLLDLGLVRNVARVSVNGAAAGVKLWRPYRFNITELIKSGENTVEIGVRATGANLFSRPRESGLLDTPRLILSTELTGDPADAAGESCEEYVRSE